jgi:16S rRNA (cytosine967-C5)-methyltransferase
MIAPARRVAFDLLQRIAVTDAHSDELLRTMKVNALAAQDRNLVTTLVLGTLRWQLALDQILLKFLTRPDQRLSEPVRAALRMGAFQLLHLDRVPPHAVLNDSVELVKLSNEAHASGLVNAVLRKVMHMPRGAGMDAMAAHPAWLVARWRRHFGAEAAQAICEYDQQASPVALRVQSENLAEELAGEGVECAPGEWLSDACRVLRGDVARTRAFAEGRVRVQDEGSQLVAELAAAAMPEAQQVLDACAAPGGKTAVLAERLPQARIRALEISERRREQMRRNLKAYEGRVDCVAGDASALGAGSALEPGYDLILCDAPCSGTGTMARNPEIRLRVYPEDLARQQARQVAILRGAAGALRPGGRVVYATCSLEPEENEDVVRAVAARMGLRVVEMAPLVEQLAANGVLTARGRENVLAAITNDQMRTLPGVHPCDGFFAAVLEREK